MINLLINIHLLKLIRSSSVYLCQKQGAYVYFHLFLYGGITVYSEVKKSKSIQKINSQLLDTTI